MLLSVRATSVPQPLRPMTQKALPSPSVRFAANDLFPWMDLFPGGGDPKPPGFFSKALLLMALACGGIAGITGLSDHRLTSQREASALEYVQAPAEAQPHLASKIERFSQRQKILFILDNFATTDPTLQTLLAQLIPQVESPAIQQSLKDMNKLKAQGMAAKYLQPIEAEIHQQLKGSIFKETFSF